MWVKAHYNGKKLLSQKLFFETMYFWTSNKLILKGCFANDTWNKVVRNTKNMIVKKIPFWNWYLMIKNYINEKIVIVMIYYKGQIYFKNHSKDYQTWWRWITHSYHMNSLSHFSFIWKFPFMWFKKKTFKWSFSFKQT